MHLPLSSLRAFCGLRTNSQLRKVWVTFVNKHCKCKNVIWNVAWCLDSAEICFIYYSLLYHLNFFSQVCSVCYRMAAEKDQEHFGWHPNARLSRRQCQRETCITSSKQESYYGTKLSSSLEAIHSGILAVWVESIICLPRKSIMLKSDRRITVFLSCWGMMIHAPVLEDDGTNLETYFSQCCRRSRTRVFFLCPSFLLDITIFKFLCAWCLCCMFVGNRNWSEGPASTWNPRG